MDNQTVTPEMREKLRAPLPPEAVTKHPTKTYLSSIKAIYVFERLNDVFGVGSYIITSDEISCDNGFPVVKVRLQIPAYGIDLSSYGGNDNGGANSKNYDLGDAYKGAATDAVTKICSWLEIGMSVFKGQGNAPQPSKSEAKQQPAKAPEKAPQAPVEKKPEPMTPAQQEEMLKLINEPVFTQKQRDDLIAKISKYNKDSAAAAIDKMKKSIEAAKQPANAAV